MAPTPASTAALASPDGQPNESSAVVEWLSQRQNYPQSTRRVELRETHISWVFLTDRFAYKLKKPVRFDFLDFSTPQARRAACEAELRLNRRLARDVYLDVLPITRDSHGHLRWGGNGEPLDWPLDWPVDWVVKMRRLPAGRMLDELIRDGCLTNSDVVKLAGTLAKFFQQALPLVIATGAFHQSLLEHVRGNRRELLAPSHALPADLIKRIHAAQLRFLECQADRFDQRVCDGRIIDGHGDLRPEHVCLLGQPVIFDCVEFNADLRRLDVADELAFFSMECDRLGADWVGDRIIQAYQQVSGDSISGDMLNFYKSYRACVRAKVAALRAGQNQPAVPLADPDSLAYLNLADRYSATLGPPVGIVLGGLMGTGKSTLAEALADRLGAELIQTDQVRREMFGQGRVDADYGQGAYTSADRDRVYEEVIRRAGELLDRGVSVVLDGTFLRERRRVQAAGEIESHGGAPLVLRCTCPEEVALERIARRGRQGQSLSEARPEHFRLQCQEQEPNSGDLVTSDVDTTVPLAAQMDFVLSKFNRIGAQSGSPGWRPGTPETTHRE